MENIVVKKISEIVPEKYKGIFRRNFPSYIRDWFVNPYSEFENKYKFIFIHIPKCAGHSVITSLFGKSCTNHENIIAYRRKNKKKFNASYKFTFVRNPYDRMVSAFFFLKRGITDLDREFAAKHLNQFDNFKDFALELKNLKFKKSVGKCPHFKPQHTFICDKNNNIAVDFVGHLESIQTDFLVVKEHFKIECNLLKKNNTKHKPYQDYYNEEIRKIVYEIYKKDFDLFNYSHKII